MALLETLQDNFDDNSRDTAKWNQYGTTTVPSETNQQLEITTSTTLGYGGYTSVNTLDFTNSYVVAELVNAGNQSLTSLEVFPVQVYKDADNVLFWYVSGGILVAYQQVANVNTQLATTTYNSTTHRWLRIRESGGRVYFDYASDGGAWITLTSLLNPWTPITAVTAELSCGTFNNEASATTVIFDNFNIFSSVSTDNGLNPRMTTKQFSTGLTTRIASIKLKHKTLRLR